jgi:effector-binding domain-containing protein
VLDAGISLAESPSGKAIKFQHRGAYDDIDSTYEAITAYLDEKGIDARNLFVEDYLNEAKDSTDINLQVDIYVFLKDAPLAPTPAAPVPALPAATSSAPAAK